MIEMDKNTTSGGPLFYLGTRVPHMWIKGFTALTPHDFILVCMTVGLVCFLKTTLSAVLATTYDPLSVRLRKRDSNKLIPLSKASTRAPAPGVMTSSIRSYQPSAPGIDRDETCETTVFIQRNPSDRQINGTVDLTSENRRTIATDEMPTLPLTSFKSQRNRYSDSNFTQDEETVDLTPSPPDIISSQPHAAGTSYNQQSSTTSSNRRDSTSLLDKYPMLRFHNLDVKDTSPSHAGPKPLQIEELDRLIEELRE